MKQKKNSKEEIAIASNQLFILFCYCDQEVESKYIQLDFLHSLEIFCTVLTFKEL